MSVKVGLFPMKTWARFIKAFIKTRSDARPKSVKSYKMTIFKKINVNYKFTQTDNSLKDFTLPSSSKSWSIYPKYRLKLQKKPVSLYSVFVGSNIS